MCRHKGFTLVELLVALAIFAIIVGFAYRGLDAMLQSRVALEKESRKWRDTSVFVGRIGRDISAALARPVSSAIESTGSMDGLALTRSGSPLQENALAAPQRIAYRLRDSMIERLTWYGVDAAPREDPTAVVVLRSVSALSFRFLDARGEWQVAWGLPGNPDAVFPAAVEVTLQLASGERIVRLFDLPQSGA
jgi:general secretion pathway protein J